MKENLINVSLTPRQARIAMFFSTANRMDQLERLMRDGFFEAKGCKKIANKDDSGTIRSMETRSTNFFDEENNIIKMCG